MPLPQLKVSPMLRDVEYEPRVEVGLKFEGGTPKTTGKRAGTGWHHAIRVETCKPLTRSYADGVQAGDILVALNNELMIGRSLNTVLVDVALCVYAFCTSMLTLGHHVSHHVGIKLWRVRQRRSETLFS